MMRLNDDERRFIGYLRSRGGSAYLYEVKRALGMPSSSAWRIARRLREWGLVKIEKMRVGRRELLRILLRR